MPTRSRLDARSNEASEYRRHYKTTAWRRIRAQQLNSEPLCRMCNEAGRITAATVCDHIKPHKGDLTLFYAGPFMSLCSPCHSRYKQREERTGKRSGAIGIDGWLIQP